ncbi:hypothetical protein DFH06DRAFT_1137830 [Mycena polygramma]|nr:hypothetical protein DFH06DRAFT_1137830 [Mycena polygramma]
MPKASKPRPVRSPKKKPVSSPFIDDEAVVSGDDGELFRLSVPSSAEPDTQQPDENEEDPFEHASQRSNSITPPPRTQAVVPQKKAEIKGKKPSTARKASSDREDGDVIELTSSDEDLAVMDEDDSMFRKPPGVKATALPPSLLTRSAAARHLSSSPVIMKPAGRSKKNSGSGSADNIESPTVDVEKFMQEWKRMNKHFDGNLASMIAGNTRDKGAASSSKVKEPRVGASSSRISPEWDPPYGQETDAADPVTPSPSRKRSAMKSGSKRESLRALGSDDDSDLPASLSKSLPPAKRRNTRGTSDVVVTAPLEAKPDKKGKVAAKPKLFLSDEEDNDDVTAEITKFKPPGSALKGGKSGKPQTMAQFFNLPDEEEETKAPSSNTLDKEHSTVFLEDIETDPEAPCGVTDPDLQDPLLRSTYSKLPPLPANRQVIAAYDPNRNAGIYSEPVKGGRVKYTIWQTYIRDMLVDNSYGALTFAEASPNFINPSRVSPVRLSSKVSMGSTSTLRLHVDDRIATCVSALFCSESKVVAPVKIGGKSERMRKWISGVFHNQEWERFESLMCLVFGEQLLRAQISTKNAVSFQTMISPDSGSSTKDSDDMFSTSAPADMFSPVRSTKATKTTSSPNKFSSARSKTLLAYNDRVPIYDARKLVVDFDSDLGRLDEVLPPFIGEVPFGSFISVGYTCSVYNAAVSGTNERAAHLGCNVLWVIVCGTPKGR